MVSHRYTSSKKFSKLVIFLIFLYTSTCRLNMLYVLFLVEWELLKIFQCYGIYSLVIVLCVRWIKISDFRNLRILFLPQLPS